MAGNLNEGALSPKQLQVNNYYRIRRSDEATGGYKLILFQYMGSDGGEDFPLRFRYVETNQTIRYKEVGSSGSYSNAVMREGATGPTFIYPVDETLRNLALRQIPSETFYRPGGQPGIDARPDFGDWNTHDMARGVYDGVKEETARYNQLTGDEIYKQNYGSGRKSRKRKTRKSKKRARKTRRRY